MATRWETCIKETLSYNPLTGKLSWAKRGKGIQFNKEPGCVNKIDGYRIVGVGGNTFKYHNLVWFLHYGEWPELEIDHINRDPLDNKIKNLRLATRQQNAANRKMGHNNFHKFKGMSYEKDRKKWLARIRVDGVLKNLGRYDNIVDAAKAYDKAALRYFGEFAHLNIPWELNNGNSLANISDQI